VILGNSEFILTYLRDRLLLAKELLSDSGSCFVQISDHNLHHVRELMDDVFKASNFVSVIYYTTSGGFTSTTLSRAGDFLIWYAKNLDQLKYRSLFETKHLPSAEGDSKYDQDDQNVFTGGGSARPNSTIRPTLVSGLLVGSGRPESPLALGK